MAPTLRLGGQQITELLSLRIAEAINTDAQAQVAIPPSEVLSGVADYRSMMLVEEIEAPIGQRSLFTGWVTSVDVRGGKVEIRARSGAFLDEARFEQFSVAAGMPNAEMAWSIGRIAGIRPDHLQIDGFRPQRDEFAVAMPLRDAPLSGDLDIDGVLLTRNRALAEPALGRLVGDESKDRFIGAGAWAWTTVSASTVFDAEQRGSSVLRGAVDRLALLAQYSFCRSPGGEVVPFDRESIYAQPALDPFVLTIASSGPRCWLRSQTLAAISPSALNPKIVATLPGVGVDERWDESLAAWRRSTRSTDPIEAVIALFDSIEFFSAGTRMTPLLGDQDLTEAREAIAGAKLEQPARDRILQLIAGANEPPLLLRFRSALSARGVPFNDREIDAVATLRGFRDDFVHGKSRREPPGRELDMVKALVGRMLVFGAQSS